MKKKHSKLFLWQQEAETHLCPCGRQAETVDHIIPVQLMRQLLQIDAVYEDAENFRFLCKTCNQIKANQLDYQNPKTIFLLKKYLVDLEVQIKPINQPTNDQNDKI